MISTNESVKFSILKALAASVFAGTLFYAPSSYAVSDAATMLLNLASAIPNFMTMITALAYVMGMFFIFKGVMGLREFGESRTMMTSHHSLKGPGIYLAVGTALMYLPSSIAVGLNTFWGDSNPYSYPNAATDQWSTLYQDCFLFVQLIGVFTFIRGLVVLTQLGGQGGQPGTFAKGLTLIISGALCINLYEFINMVYNTLSLGSS
jgi:intracellular multiplication protein IcmC